MRLLDAKTKKLELFYDHNRLPHYAIVSHRWGPEEEEVLFADVDNVPRAKRNGRGYAKVRAACEQATRDGLSYVWLDTCCIDKSNQVELTEAINSMHRWYHTSEVCYAYLHDIDDISKLSTSEWFKRGWTLQELIAPRKLMFFDKRWRPLGYRDEQRILGLVTNCTGIDPGVLGSERAPRDVSIAQRMRWAAGRITTKEEDKAYSLLGLFDVHMSATYGIKHKAFEKLQHKIMKAAPDHSLFAWSPAVDHQDTSPRRVTGFLAGPTLEYLNVYEIPADDFYHHLGLGRAIWESCSFKSGAVCTTLPMRRAEHLPSVYEVLLRCSLDPPHHPTQRQRPLVIYLTDAGRFGRFVRIHDPASWSSCEDVVEGKFELMKIHVDEVFFRDSPSQTRNTISFPQIANPDAAVSASPVGGSVTEHIAENPEDWRNQVPPAGQFSIRHPLGTKTTNIIVCGEPGAGAAGVVNLILGRSVIPPHGEFKRRAMSCTTYDITTTNPPRNLRIFYVVGPQEHRLGAAGYNSALENATGLVQKLCEEGGVHLLLCCMRKTKIDRKTHRLFYRALCRKRVPAVALVVGLSPVSKSTSVDLTGIRCKTHAMISVVSRSPSAHVHREEILGLLSFCLRSPYYPRNSPRTNTKLRRVLGEFLSESARDIVKPPAPYKGWFSLLFD